MYTIMYYVNKTHTLGAKTAPGVGRSGNGNDVVPLFALAYCVVVHLCAHRVLVVQLTRVVLETLFSQPCNHTHRSKLKYLFLYSTYIEAVMIVNFQFSITCIHKM